MRKSYTELDKKNWIERYVNGETARNIAKDYPNTSESTIAKVIKAAGFSRGKGNIPQKKQFKELIIKEYQENKTKTLTDLSKEYKLDPRTIKKWLLEENVQIKQKSGYISNCNEDYFSIIDSPNKAYLLGFITADGAITSKNNGSTKSCSIEVQEKDKKVLEFAQKEINPLASLTCCNYGRKHNYRISFCSTKLCNDLKKFGIVQNKSKIIDKVPENLIPKTLLPFYFRGLIDGDGSVGEDGRVSIYSGSQSYIKDVQRLLCQEANLSLLKVYQGTTYFVSWNSKKDKEKLFNYLYSDLTATYFYPRKYERLQKYLQGNIELT